MQNASRLNTYGLDIPDQRRLAKALEQATDVRLYRRLQAVLLLARGWTVPDVAGITGARPWAIYAWLRRYRCTRQTDSLDDAARSGRPAVAPSLTNARIIREFHRDPFCLGYHTTGWTVALLARHLSQTYGCPIS